MSLLSGKEGGPPDFHLLLSGHKALQTPQKWTLKNSFMFGAREGDWQKECVDSFNTFLAGILSKLRVPSFSFYLSSRHTFEYSTRSPLGFNGP